MKVENAFSIYIVKDTIKNWYKYKKELLSLVEDIPLVAEGYYSDYCIKEKKIYSDRFFEILSPTLKKFGEMIERPFNIPDLWAQRYIKGGASHQCHNHGALGFSAVFYASLGKTDRGTRFICPFNDSVDGSNIDYVPKVKEGDIIFFPSFLMHQSTPTIDDTERIIFSFNLK